MNKDSNIIIRIDSKLKDDFKKLCNKNGVSVSGVIGMTIEKMVKRDQIPIPITYRLRYLKNYSKMLTIPVIKKKLKHIFDRTEGKIEKAYLFGSYSRGEETNDSDVDIRLVVKRGFTLIDQAEIVKECEKILEKKVDIVTSGNLNSVFLNEIRKEEICIYEQ